MHFVYVLQSLKTYKLYIGYTSDLKRRLLQHNKGLEIYSKKEIPWKLIYYEAYKSKTDAVKREKQLKHYKSAYGFLKKRIKYSLFSIEPKKRGEIEIDDEA